MLKFYLNYFQNNNINYLSLMYGGKEINEMLYFLLLLMN
jgi:hypothetical protein